MLTFVTFGQVHAHSINGKTLDKDCVAVFGRMSEADVRALLHDSYNNEYAQTFNHTNWDVNLLKYFPRGYVYVDFEPEDGLLG
jgi:hypothetical protein